MDQAERIGLGVAVAAHGALFAALSFGLIPRPHEIDPRDALAVTITDEIGLESSSPDPAEAAPAPEAPEIGPPEAAPPEPELTPAPRVEPTPPPPRRAERPMPRRERPTPRRESRPERTERPARPELRPRGSRLAGIDEGISQNPSRSTSRASSAASVTGAQRSAYTALIRQQILRCVDRQTPPGPGAESIRTSLTVRFNADGSLAGRPNVRRQTGFDDSSARYRERVGELAVASVMACSPITGLPASLYRTDSGQGWHSVDLVITIDPQG